MTERSGRSAAYGDSGLVTDNDTDMLYCMMINDGKVHPDRQSELNREKINQVNQADPIATKVSSPHVKSYHKRKPEYRGLPSIQTTPTTDRNRSEAESEMMGGGYQENDQTGVCFDDCSIQYPRSRDVLRVNQPLREDYVFKSNRSARRAHGHQRTDLPSTAMQRPINPVQGLPNIAAGIAGFAPVLGKTLLGGNGQDYRKTDMEIRCQARNYYCQLMEQKTKYGAMLTKEYTMDDDPEEMKAELDLHKEMRNRGAKLKMSKDVLSFSVCVMEFLNAEYNPLKLKLDNWSQQVGADLDNNDYDDVLQELCEKYTAKGSGMFGGWAPEVKLLAMMGGGALMYHFSNLKSGPTLKDEIKNDPDTAAKIIGDMLPTRGECQAAAAIPDKQTQSSIDMIRRRRAEAMAARNPKQMPTLQEIASVCYPGMPTPYRSAYSKTDTSARAPRAADLSEQYGPYGPSDLSSAYPEGRSREVYTARPSGAYSESRPSGAYPPANAPRTRPSNTLPSAKLTPQLRVFDDAQRTARAEMASSKQSAPKYLSPPRAAPQEASQGTLRFEPEESNDLTEDDSIISLIRDDLSELIESLHGTSEEPSSSKESNSDHSSSSDQELSLAYPPLFSEERPKLALPKKSPISSARKPALTSTRRRAMLLV